VTGARAVAIGFGRNLRRCRKRAGISQEALGERAGLHRTEIGLLERGARTPRVDTVIRLASSLSIPAAELLAGITWTLGHIEVVDGAFEVDEPEAD
jgi:transcriptional regulator with XRE-family HTH domain